jgi:hypothetical protein
MIDGSAPSTPEEARNTQAIILTSLPVGVTLFAVVGLWIRRNGHVSDPGPLLAVWLIGTIATLLAAVIVWQRLVRPHLAQAGRDPTGISLDTIGRFQTGQIICMALIEGMALFGGVILIISGTATPALFGVALAWVALVILWPRREWYGLR